MYSPRDPLGEYLNRKITFRQLRVMVEHLPVDPSTPYGRVVNGPWGDPERLLHDVDWQLRLLNANFINANRDKSREPADAEPLPLPPLTVYQQEKQAAEKESGMPQNAVEAALLEVLSRT